MQIGTFRRNVAKTFTKRGTKRALLLVAKSPTRTQIAQAAVLLKVHTGQYLQSSGQYLLGMPLTQEMKEEGIKALGDIGFDLTALARLLKVKLPSSTKRSKLVGTRGAAILHLDSLATDILRYAAQGLFTAPQMSTVKKLVPMPQKGGVKEERDVEVVDAQSADAAEQARQTAIKSFLSGAIDVFWRLCYDATGQPPVVVLDAKFARMPQEYPGVSFDAGSKPKAKIKTGPVAVVKKASKKAKDEAVVPA